MKSGGDVNEMANIWCLNFIRVTMEHEYKESKRTGFEGRGIME